MTPHKHKNVASMLRMGRLSRIVPLGSSVAFSVVCIHLSYVLTLQNYLIKMIAPIFWDKQHGNVTDGLFAMNKMPFLYGCEEGDACNSPCNRDEV